MKVLSSALVLLLGILSVRAQTQSCQVADESGRLIPYVNVYNDNLELGVISDAEGVFQLDLGRLVPEDQLTFSCVGYETQTVAVRELPPGPRCQVILKERAYDLAAAEVVGRQTRFRQRKAGITTRSPLVQAGFIGSPARQLGFEVGTIMENRELCYLDAVGLNLTYATHDTMFFEINIYDFADGRPGEPLHQRRLFLEFAKEDLNKPIELDLRAQPIRVERDFLVAVEMVSARGEESYGIIFPAKRRAGLSMAKNPRGEWEAHELGASIYCRMRCVQP
jgi:hypothetical protein